MNVFHLNNFIHGARTPSATLGCYRTTFVLGTNVGNFSDFEWDDEAIIPHLLKNGYGVGVKPGTTGDRLGGNYHYSKRFQTLRTDLRARNEDKYAMIREVYKSVRPGEDCLMVMTPMCDQITGMKPTPLEAQISTWVRNHLKIEVNRIYR